MSERLPESAHGDPIARLLENGRALILDGGLATTLEERGCDLDHALWSARMLIERPSAIRDVHHDFLEAGADCIATATYQASLEGFRRHGLTDDEAVGLLEDAVRLAVEARDAYWNRPQARAGRSRPLVAASVGPYGAFLADGSEYRGDYVIGVDALLAFHRRRWHILAGSPADLLACETIPSFDEVRALLTLLRETPGTYAWLSLSCRDARHLADGTPLAEVVRAADAAPNLSAIGVNCVPPAWVPSLIGEIRSATTKPIVVYPNSGERWDAARRRWAGGEATPPIAEEAERWRALGASIIGGCCRVPPAEIAELRRRLAG